MSRCVHSSKAQWVLWETQLYTVSQKNDTDVAHYNFNAHQWILVIFGRNVAERVYYQTVICYSTKIIVQYRTHVALSLSKITKMVDWRWSYSVQCQCCFFWDTVYMMGFVPGVSCAAVKHVTTGLRRVLIIQLMLLTDMNIWRDRLLRVRSMLMYRTSMECCLNDWTGCDVASLHVSYCLTLHQGQSDLSTFANLHFCKLLTDAVRWECCNVLD